MTGEYLLCFLCPWVIPKKMLKNYRYCINFHPGPLRYPGIGGYDLALKNHDSTYGVTVHHMLAVPDTGPIIMTMDFPIIVRKVGALKDLTHNFLYQVFDYLYDFIKEGYPLPMETKKWTRKPYTRKEVFEGR